MSQQLLEGLDDFGVLWLYCLSLEVLLLGLFQPPLRFKYIAHANICINIVTVKLYISLVVMQSPLQVFQVVVGTR